ncbi:MAG: phenylalanine--tRNA ligase subunit alpha [Nitrospirae bacterium]|nr:phenylalanine--tRNA ligase subunit alpha [Nitrospirota bacterium]
MTDTKKLLEGMHPFEIKVLQAFINNRKLSEDRIGEMTGLMESQVSMAIGWLQAKGIIELVEEEVAEMAALTEIGIRYADEKLPEIRILDWAKNEPGLTIGKLKEMHLLEPEELSSAIGALRGSGVIKIGQGGIIEIAQNDPIKFLMIQEFIKELDGNRRDKREYPIPKDKIKNEAIRLIYLEEYTANKRGGGEKPFKIIEKRRRIYAISGGKEDLLKDVEGLVAAEEVSQLTPLMLKDGSWRGKRFRRYNISLRPPRLSIGRKHPYREFLDQVKSRLVAMGFVEMRGPLVESEFWNMDALYMPQFHPAREIHDVYFVKKPGYSKEIDEPYLSQVAMTHNDGWKTGSRGWGYKFDKERARRLILRSQGTAVSARTLAGKPGIPGRYFSIARCFRYDQVDATHAPDFYQVEGIVLGEEINFRMLLGLLELFAVKMAGARDVRFLPAYFPFTEPSVELHVKHPGLGWMELGGAGLFRPEVTMPLGIRVPVIAWGLGLDRMAMIALGIEDIRDLFSTDLDMIRTKRVRI